MADATEIANGFSPIFYVSIIALILVIFLAIFLIKKGRGNFKPTLWKVIFSIISVVIWIFLMNFIYHGSMCKLCQIPQCDSNYFDSILVKPICGWCDCYSFAEMLSSNLQNILIPFVVVYVIWSLVQKRKMKK